jgi:hypothetical protein
MTACKTMTLITLLGTVVTGRGYWQLRSEFARQDNVGHDVIKAVLIDHWKKEDSAPTAESRKNLMSHYQQVLDAPAVEIRFYTSHTKDGTSERTCDGVMYFARGDLFVRYRQCDDTNGDYCLNYATVDGKLYEWAHNARGETNGRTLASFPGDTVELVDYLIDPAMLKRFLYCEYAQRPDLWSQSSADERRLSALVPEHQEAGLVALVVENEPFWLKSLVFKKHQEPMLGEFTATVERPRAVDAVPAEMLRLPKDVKFQDSNVSVEWRLKFW